MFSYRFEVTIRNTVQIILITLAADTLKAVLLTAVEFGDGFTFNFIASQCIGLTCASFIVFGFFLLRPVSLIAQGGVLSVFLVTGATSGIFLASYLLECINPASIDPFNFPQLLFISVITGLVITLFFISQDRIYQTEKNIDKERIKRLYSEKQTVEAEIKMLQAQIEPHFLYNTLFNIRSLMDSDTDQAKQMLDNFSGFLRLSLSCSRKERTTVDEEVQLIRSYLDVFKGRMDERLTYVIEVDEDIRSTPFPPMLLQPLVENALKHGLEPSIRGGCITIRGRKSGEMIRMEIIDNGVGLTESGGTGVGLSNIRERLRVLYGERARLILEDNHPTGVKASIEVPHE